jgi:hypothetical protein
MDDLFRRYNGKTTSQGHKVTVGEHAGVNSIGFKHTGEYQDQYDPTIQVARIERVGDGFQVGWFHDDAEEPTSSNEYTAVEDLYAALDQAIERRSIEVGTNGA